MSKDIRRKIQAAAVEGQKSFFYLALLGAAGAEARPAASAEGVDGRSLFLSVELLVIQYMKDAGVERALGDGTVSTPRFTGEEIKDFLVSCSPLLGIDSGAAGNLASEVLDKLVARRGVRRWYNPLGGGKRVPVRICGHDDDGYYLDQDFLLEYAKLIDFQALGGTDRLDLKFYMLRMAMENKEYDAAISRLSAILTSIVEERRYYAERTRTVASRMAEGLACLDKEALARTWGSYSEKQDEIGGHIETFKNLMEVAEEGSAEEAVGREGRDLGRLCSYELLRLVKTIQDLIGEVEKLSKEYSPHVSIDMFDFNRVVVSKLPALGSSSSEALWYYLTARFFGLDPETPPRLACGSLLRVPRDKNEAATIVVEGVETNGDGWAEYVDPSSELEAKAETEIRMLREWLEEKKDREGELGGFLSTDDSGESLVDPVFFSRLFTLVSIGEALEGTVGDTKAMGRGGETREFSELLLKLL